jgi:hypothetical protein
LSCATVLDAPKTPLESVDAIGPLRREYASANATGAVMAMLLLDPLCVTPKVSPVRFPASL